MASYTCCRASLHDAIGEASEDRDNDDVEVADQQQQLDQQQQAQYCWHGQ